MVITVSGSEEEIIAWARKRVEEQDSHKKIQTLSNFTLPGTYSSYAEIQDAAGRLTQEEWKMIRSGKMKINAIKEIRQRLHCGLKEAKDIAEHAYLVHCQYLYSQDRQDRE